MSVHAAAQETITGTVPCRICGLPVDADDPDLGSYSTKGGVLQEASHRRNPFGDPKACMRAMSRQIVALTARLDELSAADSKGRPR